MGAFKKDNYRFFLLCEFQRRIKRNSSYSWRAFARDLGLTPSRITEIMKGKAGLSVDRAKTFVGHLNLIADDRDLFLDLVEMEHGRNKVLRQLAKERVLNREALKKVIPDEQFSLISQWYYLPLMRLLELPLPSQDPSILAKTLGLEEIQIVEGLARLEEVGLICKNDDRYTCLNSRTITDRGSPSSGRRQYHKELLKKAEEAIDTQPLAERSFTSAVMTVDKSQLELVQKRIRQFRSDLLNELDASPSKNAVYCLALNFFALTGNIES
jgi:uncharacterized protein (TIGR02147 family)